MNHKSYIEAVRSMFSIPEWDGVCDDFGGVLSRLQSADPSELTWPEFQMALEEGFKESVVFLPYAMEYVRRMGDGASELSAHVVIFANSYAEDLQAAGLYEGAVEELTSILWAWLDVYQSMAPSVLSRVARELRFGACVCTGSDRDDYLDCILCRSENLIVGDAVSLGESLLLQWADTEGKPKWSAHFLDMCAKSRDDDINWYDATLYQCDVMQRFLGNQKLLDRHLSCATACWEEEQTPVWYRKEVERVLRIDE